MRKKTRKRDSVTSIYTKKSKPRIKKDQIIIDAEKKLIFDNDEALFKFFGPHIDQLEKEYIQHRKKTDLNNDKMVELADNLDEILDEPDEIWHDAKTFPDFALFTFIRELPEIEAFHIAICYVNQDDEVTFVFMNFVTNDIEMVNHYRRQDLIFDRAFEELEFAAIEGDSMSEGDPFAMGLFLAMMKVRSEKDIANSKFQALGDLREETIESPDEIWRTNEMGDVILVNFIKEFHDHEEPNLYYIAVTQEDPASNVHSLLFSFPTNDSSLVDRYRRGENMQAEEVSQESTH